MRISAYFDRLNNKKIFGCYDAYDHKETLKSLGFVWNPFGKQWQKEYKTYTEMVTILVDVMVDCDLDLDVFYEASSRCYDEFKHAGREDNYTKESLKKFRAKYDDQ